MNDGVDGGPDGRGDAESAATLSPPAASDASGYGVTMTLVGGVLLALAYYGYLSLRAGRDVGQALPEPFYVLGIALLFVVELLNSRRLGIVVAVGRAIAFAAVYGALFVLAVEGGAYVWAEPAVALDGFVGVTVLAIALVVAALLYVGYLTVRELDGE